MSNVITGLFNNASDASTAIRVLEFKGISANDISIIANDSTTKDSFAVTDSSKLPEGIAIGATSGGVLAAIAGGLTAVGTVASGGIGLLASGPIVAALSAGGAGAAAGGLIGGAIGLSIPEHEVKFYEDAIEKGSVLVGVHAKNDDVQELIEEVFADCEAENIATA
jgi:hypothetical protein